MRVRLRLSLVLGFAPHDLRMRYRQYLSDKCVKALKRFRIFFLSIQSRFHSFNCTILDGQTMPTVHFIGRIVPATAIQVALSHPKPDENLTVTYISPENDLEAKLTFRIAKSIVDVECELNRFANDPTFLAILHKPVFDRAQAIVSLVGFSTGHGLTLHFEYIKLPDGNISPLLIMQPNLAVLCTAFNLQDPTGLLQMMNIVLSDHSLCIALNELNEAITLTHHAITSCERCIERLRTSMCPGIVDRKQAWIEFGRNLQLSKDYLKMISEYSTGPRHGDPTFIPGTVVIEITQRAWVTVNRFLEYRKRGNVMLPLSGFPLL